MILKQIKECALKKANDKTITDLRIGLSYTLVEVNNEHTGVAWTPKNLQQSCCQLNNNELLIGSPATKLIHKFGSHHQLENTLALATINAMVNQNNENSISADVTKLLSIQQHEQVAMIGYFGPLVSFFKEKQITLHILEKDSTKETVNINMLDQVAEECACVIITATTLINNEFELYLQKFLHCKDIIILGPSTPLIPEIFFDHGVTTLSGIQVIDKEKLKQIICHGFGTRQFKKAVKKINLTTTKL
jgi:uncharacterized protein (DUF4213/DUF364 family)